jgi:hypothetical protein
VKTLKSWAFSGLCFFSSTKVTLMVRNDKCMLSKTNFLNCFNIIKCSSEENCISEKRNEVPLEKINLQIERNEILCGGQLREKYCRQKKKKKKKSYVGVIRDK